MHGVNAMRATTVHDDYMVDLITAAAKDAFEIAFLEGVLRTTMRATKDDTTRRAIRVKLDALESARQGSATAPNAVPANFG